MKREQKIFRLLLLFIIISVILYLHLLSHKKADKIYKEQLDKTIISMESHFLKDTVNNVFIEIDKLRERKAEEKIKAIDQVYKRLKEKELSHSRFIEIYEMEFYQEKEEDIWTAALWDFRTGEIIYQSPNILYDSIEDIEENLAKETIYYRRIEKDNLRGVFGVNKKYIDEIAREEAGAFIRAKIFANKGYLWVNQVLNYYGGEKYAIRLIHPSLPETEGMFLSTEMKDIKGNLPYLNELNGVKDKGEAFLQYYFKEPDSENISKKISYARLYKDFDWIISMGVHLNQIEDYSEKVNKETNILVNRSIVQLLFYIFLALFVSFGSLYILEKKTIIRSTEVLEKRINIDKLTGAGSRFYGEKSLEYSFKEFKKGGLSPGIMLFDVDNFKCINDKYGHEVGDKVLYELSSLVQGIIRNSDILIRWGGDEFVAIFPGLTRDNTWDLGKKVYDLVSKLSIENENKTIRLKISIGFSFFHEEDSNYHDVLRRADRAMYISKSKDEEKVSLL